jgi:hypothetical protein
VTEFLKRDYLHATEMQIFEAVLRWSRVAEKSRSASDGTIEACLWQQTVLMIPACVRLYRMSARRLADVIRPSGFVPDSVLVDVYEEKLENGVFVQDNYL